MTVINGMEYAESNYPNYWWCWNYCLLTMFQDVAPTHYHTGVRILESDRRDLIAGGDGLVTYNEIGKWLEFRRCPCGVGWSPRKIDPGAPEGRWLCATCGRGEGTLVLWIGRRTANRWEWKAESELPVDLRPKCESDKPPLETYEPGELDRRVKAAVEVEVAVRMAAMEGR